MAAFDFIACFLRLFFGLVPSPRKFASAKGMAAALIVVSCASGIATEAEAVTYNWHNDAYTGTLTSGDLCTTDGTIINCTTVPSSIGGTPGGSNTQIQYNNSGVFGGASNFVWNNTSNFLGLGTATASAQFHMAGGATAPAWTTSGIAFRQDAATYTDSSSSGTISANYVDVIGQPTLAASSATTYTNAATMFIAGAPAAGSNVAITNPAALVVGSGNVGIGTAAPLTTLDVRGVVTAGDAVSSSGSILMQGYYTLGALTVFGTEYATGGPVIGYGVSPSTAASGSFLSSTSASVSRDAISMGNDGNITFYTSSGGSIPIGSTVAMSPVMTILNGGNVGIGTTSPGSTLQVNGGAAIGYSTSQVAPSNGLAVSGSVGIGSTSPQQPLDVAGPIKVAGTGSEVCDTAHLGSIRYNPTTGLPQMCINH